MNFESLVNHISAIQDTLQAQAAHAVNLALTSRNWLMGYYIVEFEQRGEDRAAYGEQLLKKLEKRLNTKGLNERRFREFRRLYLVYPQLKDNIIQFVMSENGIRHTLTAEFTEPIRHTPCAELQSTNNQDNKWHIPAHRLFNKLPYSHLKFISKIDNPIKRAFYEMESIRGCWSARELERQISSLYYERSGLSKNKEALSALVQQQVVQLQPADVINIPVTFRHEYASQLNMYLNYYKGEIMQSDDNPPIGILLCTDKGDTLVRYATAGLDPNIFVQKYMVQLPSEEEIKKFISKRF